MARRAQKSSAPPGLFGTIWRLTLAGGLFFALAAGAGYATVYSLVKTPETEAPDLLAISATEALERASAQGFAARIDGAEPSSTVEDGFVVAQRPAPGSWVKEGAVIGLTVAE